MEKMNGVFPSEPFCCTLLYLCVNDNCQHLFLSLRYYCNVCDCV